MGGFSEFGLRVLGGEKGIGFYEWLIIAEVCNKLLCKLKYNKM